MAGAQSSNSVSLRLLEVQMSFLIVSTIFSLALILVLHAFARSRFGVGGAFVAAAGATLLSCMMTPALAYHALLTSLLLLGALVFQMRPKVVVPFATGAMLASYAFCLGFGLLNLRETAKLREKYPIESLAHRLAYETKAVGQMVDSAGNLQHPELSPEVEGRLDAESRFGHFRSNTGSYRRQMLSILHDHTRDAFIVARGFGPMRMMEVQPTVVDLPEPAPVPLPSPPDSQNLEHPSSVPHQDQVAQSESIPKRQELESLHGAGEVDFLEPNRMGFIQSREHVLGFQPHRFTTMPAIARPEDRPSSEWQIVGLDLVSLLKHPTPVAYVSKNLPRMDELRDAPTRPLDDFEREAVARLRKQEDVVIDEEPNLLRMVGSLRAAQDCMQCHSVPRGTLLGALSYRLVPRNARPRQPAESARPRT
jgi:hypothetical protein